MPQVRKHITLQNELAVLQLDPEGGAIVDFHLKDQPVNPLNFFYPQETITDSPHFFKGHFLCLGRWGDPSEAEQEAGIVKHGDLSRQHWSMTSFMNGYNMQARSHTEALSILRRLELQHGASVFKVHETIVNISNTGRLFNLVQHPTIARPFLTENTIVDCNATTGFDYAFETYQQEIIRDWPYALLPAGNSIDLRKSATDYSSVFSYIVDPGSKWGWLTAYSPEYNLLLGYVWPRAHYPWINLWVHCENGHIQYRGLEFGTTGIHKPYGEILEKDLSLWMGEKTIHWLDPNRPVTYAYTGFLQKMEPGFAGVEAITYDGEIIDIKPRKHTS